MKKPARYYTGHRCPHLECNEMVKRSRYSCLKHWNELPWQIQNKIYQGFQCDPKKWAEGSLEAKAFWKNQIVERDARVV